MCGICLAIDTNRQIALNELINSHFQSIDQLNLITESVKDYGLITTMGYDWIEQSINIGEQQSQIYMICSEDREKLFELALIKCNMWSGKKELKVYIKPHAFNIKVNNFIEQYSNEWSPYSGINFKFVNDLPAEIIVELNGNSVHSSLIGKNALAQSQLGNTTMHLGIGNAITIEAIKRPIIHEFGHALGCIHEHQSPQANIKWNEPVVIKNYQLGGWNETMVRQNVFNKFSSGVITNSIFDSKSIMLYPIDYSFTLDGFNVGWNTELSVLDKSFIKKAYSII